MSAGPDLTWSARKRFSGPIIATLNPMPLAVGTRLGHYEIVSTIGAGGMGEVDKARDTRLDRSVALKVLPLFRELLQSGLGT